MEVFYANMLSLLDEKEVTVIFSNVEDILLTNTVWFHAPVARISEVF